MSVNFRIPGDDDFEALATFDGRAFGNDWQSDAMERARAVIPLDRFWIGEDDTPSGGSEIVAAGGAYAMDMTLPGGRAIPTAAVTWIAVAVTHRRQGLLRELMGRLHRDATERNDPILALTASEGSIYERFGYGIATGNRVTTIDRRRARMRPEFRPPAGSVRLVPRAGVEETLVERWNRYAATQPGELSRDAAWFTSMLGRAANTTIAVHDDGFAVWKIEQNWDNGHPAHTLTVDDFCAATPEAHAALWHTMLSVDLVGPIQSMLGLAPDDPLPYLLENPRSVRTNEANDFLWIAVRDPRRAFSSRSYRTDDRLIVAAEQGTFAMSPDGCIATDADPDLRCTDAALGSLLLGGVSASELARGRRLWADPGVVSRADAFFGSDPVAHCRTFF